MTDPSSMHEVYAANVRGQGAVEVAAALIEGGTGFMVRPSDSLVLSDALARRVGGSSTSRRVRISQRQGLAGEIKRLAECLLPYSAEEAVETIFVLGDIPLRSSKTQVVLFHAPNLLPASVNPYTRKDWRARLNRLMLRRNLRFGSRFVVQSEVIRDQLVAAYPDVAGRVRVITQPAPRACREVAESLSGRTGQEFNGALTLFYPAADYPHKNHTLLFDHARRHGEVWAGSLKYELTLSPSAWAAREPGLAMVENLGRLSLRECYQRLLSADALIFPSLSESFGIPLVEAMTLGRSVLCADLPYARWACETEAIYFDPNSTDDLERALREFVARRKSGWTPDWTRAMRKFPSGWEQVADAFVTLGNELKRSP